MSEATKRVQWQADGGTIWALVDFNGQRIGWVTKRACCWYASLPDPNKARSFTLLKDAMHYVEHEMMVSC